MRFVIAAAFGLVVGLLMGIQYQDTERDHFSYLAVGPEGGSISGCDFSTVTLQSVRGQRCSITLNGKK
jgi:hypothetical protein